SDTMANQSAAVNRDRNNVTPRRNDRHAGSDRNAQTWRSWGRGVRISSIAVTTAALALIAYHARMGAVSPRIANPEVTSVPRPVEFLFGWTSGWLVLHQIGTVVMMLLLIAVCLW